MKRIKRFIQTYYVRPLYNESSFSYGKKGTLLMGFLALGLYLVTPDTIQNTNIRLLALVVLIGSVALYLLNSIGMNKLYGSDRNFWLKIPYITTIFSLISFWLYQIIQTEVELQKFVILFPILFPLISWTFQFLVMDIFTSEDKQKIKALIMGAPMLSSILLMSIGVLIDMFGILKNFSFSIVVALGINFLNLELPMWFTKTSEYWHPELKQSRYDEAMGALQQTKKSKKTGKKKKKMKLKK
ncbi:hypothetical protein [Streptococcus gallolyticus]|uniref:hypothetical protein n=1 Tax=Streptococcus gallolyticus TaxID=315405 RepID=UPI0008868F5D|nr:hypothetical protein [Streptococcus gallolyticus]SDK38120.1 hypothetical protein SAMN04487842_0065 [Streptococcus gallolyticus]SDL87103.1 hypothetical protein SAMN04487841_0065 [Streptococcus gallolyticus]